MIRRRCVCGHARKAHGHYRAGSDCGQCGCHEWLWPTTGRERRTFATLVRLTEELALYGTNRANS